MRILCDACEEAPATYFCAADEAALCCECDDQVHGCNKLANRHVRLKLTDSREVPWCDICQKGSAYFFCAVDGISLCLQCDIQAHRGGKRMHERILLMGQKVELPSLTLNETEWLVKHALSGKRKYTPFTLSKQAKLKSINTGVASEVCLVNGETYRTTASPRKLELQLVTDASVNRMDVDDDALQVKAINLRRGGRHS